MFFYEETKYIPSNVEARGHVIQQAVRDDVKGVSTTREQSVMSVDVQRIDYSIPMRTYRQRLAFTTTTKGPFSLIFRHTYQPFWILFTFPAAAYTALQYGSILAWFSVLATTEATYFYLPPYNFGPIGIGLLNLPAFLGCILGAIWGGPLSDWSILFFAKRNKGIYEPEMRLWLAMFPVLVGPAGLFLYGYSLAAVSTLTFALLQYADFQSQGMHWIIPCVGIAFFGFSLTALGDTSLSYLSDCYREILGDALVAVAFVRNMFATIIVFALAPWITGLGLHGMFTSVGCLALALNMTTLPMIIWGKKVSREFFLACARC